MLGHRRERMDVKCSGKALCRKIMACSGDRRDAITSGNL